jgi:vacuolar iron transporter family protein
MQKEHLALILNMQKGEITEHYIYTELSKAVKDENNGKILENIASDEMAHYEMWKKITGIELSPDRYKIFKTKLISRILGVTFAIKLMEAGEIGAQKKYKMLIKAVPEAEAIIKDEVLHEKHLICMIDEKKLRYIGSIVLGLNDALVELTGTLAGLTLAIQNAKIIGMAGLITGIAAALSMGASEYLSTKSEGGEKDPLTASIYTMIVYFFAVLVLVLPYFIFKSYISAIICTLIGAIVLIFAFTYYYSVVKELSFKRRFFEMASISMGVALLSFIIGYVVKSALGINI